MKDVIETILEHPFASAFVISVLGSAIATIVHGNSSKPVALCISKTKTKTEA